MNEPTKKDFTVTIRLLNGDSMQFKLKRTAAEIRNVGSNLEGGLQARYFGVELNGKLVIVPFHNISSLEIDPAPAVLISHVLRDAKPVSE